MEQKTNVVYSQTITTDNLMEIIIEFYIQFINEEELPFLNKGEFNDFISFIYALDANILFELYKKETLIKVAKDIMHTDEIYSSLKDNKFDLTILLERLEALWKAKKRNDKINDILND